METWDLDGEDITRLRALFQHDLLLWGADAGGDLTITIKGAEGSLLAWPLSESQDDGNDVLAVAATTDSFVRQVDQLLRGDQACPDRTLFDLLPDIEHLVKRAIELQDRVIEMERYAAPHKTGLEQAK